MAVVDPVSQGAQKASTIVKVLHRVLNARVRIFLNCVDKHSEMPQKSYFRMVLRPEMTFDDDDHSSLAATFEDLPKSPIYTMHHHVPENWLTGVAQKTQFYLLFGPIKATANGVLAFLHFNFGGGKVEFFKKSFMGKPVT